jgi:uncharacterized protein (TIGR02444 family)
VSDLAESLWQGIVRAYARPGIAPLCLRLQDQGDTDVTLLLCLCHAARALNAPLSVAEVEALRSRTEPWRDRAVRPLRHLRIALRAPVDAVSEDRREAFRDRLKSLELAAEKVQAGLVADWLAARQTPVVSVDPIAGLRHFLGQTPVTDAELSLLVDAFGG